MCQAVDLMFILDSSASVNNINSNNWQYVKTFISSVIQRVVLGPNSFQVPSLGYAPERPFQKRPFLKRPIPKRPFSNQS